MQGAKIQTGKQAERADIRENLTRKGLVPFLVVLFFACVLIVSGTSAWAQRADKKSKKVAPPPKESAITDGSVQDYLKKAEELLKKGETDSALPTLLKVHDYSEDVLKTVKLFQGQYEKIVNDPSILQSEREDIYLKLKRMGHLIAKYTSIREASAYDLGYAFSKKGDGDRARKYLLKVFETAPFSTKPDSLWMRSKKLLLAIYSLEGEF